VPGPDSGSNGWDGKHAWTTDSAREVRIETSGEAVAQAAQDAYRGGYAFFFPRRFPAARDYAETRKENGKSYEAVKVSARAPNLSRSGLNRDTPHRARSPAPTNR
jgi:hypothetical protein